MLMRFPNGPHALHRLRDEIDRLFSDVFDRTGTPFDLLSGPTFPPLNVWEENDNYKVEAELPGMRLEDLELTVTGAQLTIRGRREWKSPEGVTVHRRERVTGEFDRILQLPTEIDAEHVQAAFKDGVLTITLPKAPTARPRRIEVKSAPGAE